LAAVVDRVLGYVNSPFRLFAIVVLAALGLAGYLVWENRAQLAETVLHKTVVPRLEPERFAQVAPALIEVTGADAVILMRIEISNNVLRIVVGTLRDNPGWNPPSTPRAVFTSHQVIIGLIQDSPECLDLPADDPDQTIRDLAALGLTRGCIISVPPVLDVLVGALGIAWKKPLEAQSEAGAKAELRRAALRLATW
jgi:hypothetical protein